MRRVDLRACRHAGTEGCARPIPLLLSPAAPRRARGLCHCLQAGPLTKVTLCKDRDGKPKSFGFVCFKHPESVSYAIALLNGIRLYGRPINVQYRFGSSRSSEPANQSFETCVKINSHSYRNEEIMGRAPFSMQIFPITNNALPQESFFFQKMQWQAHN
ncbi:splicing regulator RBM11, partial [Octodon degus]|uniref:Splicing regulator RBM11 n=1 Tax=Octodon degus TaxID=10160 RepID=A0A6P6F6L3_OCTDE